MKVELIYKKLVCKDTYVIRVEKPVGFKFNPGDFVYISLKLDEFDQRGDKREFSIASAPKDKYLEFIYRKGISPFKKKLNSLKVNNKISISKALGTISWDKKPNGEFVFIAGGVGISPLISKIRSFPQTKIRLICFNKSSKTTPYFDELTKLQSKNLVIDFYYKKPNSLDIKKICKIHKNIIFYICGPTGFVSFVESKLIEFKISLYNIFSERFTGY